MGSLLKVFGGAVATNFVARILIALGVSFVSFTGFDALINLATDLLHDQFAAMPTDVLGLFGLANVDFAINMILSAYAARVAIFATRQMRLIK